MMNPVSVAAGILSLWGSWTKTRPQVSLIADPIFGVGQRYLYFIISNATKAPIRVTAVTVEPEFFGIWNDDSPEAAADAMCGVAASAFIDPGTEKRFPVDLISNLSDENREIWCKVTVSWRSMRHENIPCIPVVYRTRVATLEAQREGEA